MRAVRRVGGLLLAGEFALLVPHSGAWMPNVKSAVAGLPGRFASARVLLIVASNDSRAYPCAPTPVRGLRSLLRRQREQRR